MPVCDGCGSQVDDAHIRRRIERLELATRYRPVHISVLLIDAAPPARIEDFFYHATNDRSVRSPASHAYFDALTQLAGSVTGDALSEDAMLVEFQRCGFFLVCAVECALDCLQDPENAIERMAPAILRRVKISYKPKSVALLSAHTQGLIPAFEGNGWGGRLILDEGRPFGDPLPTGPWASVLGLRVRD
jgi:hypothetical protein